MAEAATFTRDSLATYEKGPQKAISNKVNPFRGATSARQATGADIANAGALSREGEPSRIQDIAPGGALAAARGAADSDDAPVVDEDGTLGDPTDSGEGTSDDLTSDSSTDTVDHGDEADTASDLTAAPDEEVAEDEPAKGSARERIVELNDKLEGAMVFGKTVQEAYKQVVEENARLRAGTSPAAAAPAAVTPPVVSDNPGPMPDMSDADINFDNDKYRAAMQKWSTKNAQAAARQVVREMTGVAQVNTLMQQVEAKVDAYSKEHPEFKELVTDNEVLKANQLAPDAGLAVARSAYTPELLVKFGKDPGFAIRVAKMHPADQLLIVGELIAEIKAEKKAGKGTTTTATTKQTTQTTRTSAQPGARKSVSQAPPPPTRTVGGGANRRFDPLDPNTSMDDVVREHRAEKERARKESRRLRGLS